jgi:hypothetical protein
MIAATKESRSLRYGAKAPSVEMTGFGFIKAKSFADSDPTHP